MSKKLPYTETKLTRTEVCCSNMMTRYADKICRKAWVRSHHRREISSRSAATRGSPSKRIAKSIGSRFQATDFSLHQADRHGVLCHAVPGGTLMMFTVFRLSCDRMLNSGDFLHVHKRTYTCTIHIDRRQNIEKTKTAKSSSQAEVRI